VASRTRICTSPPNLFTNPVFDNTHTLEFAVRLRTSWCVVALQHAVSQWRLVAGFCQELDTVAVAAAAEPTLLPR